MYNETGTLVDTVNYDDVAPWPTRPDGQGATLELISPDLDNALGQNWKASGITTHGTPGTGNSINVGIEQPAPAGLLLLSVSPNPFNSKSYLKINSGVKFDDGTVEIYNLSGQKVMQLNQIASNEVELSRNGLVSGCYILRFTSLSRNISGTVKLMVQ